MTKASRLLAKPRANKISSSRVCFITLDGFPLPEHPKDGKEEDNAENSEGAAKADNVGEYAADDRPQYEPNILGRLPYAGHVAPPVVVGE